MTSFAVVFPGQGAQSVGMLDAWGDHPAVVQTLAEASEVLGRDLRVLIHEGPKEHLDLTVNTQLVMLVAGLANYRALTMATDARPSAMAGHSLGEYTALVASGALAFADALRLVRIRAQAMQDAVPAGLGAMAAILGLDANSVAAVCAEATLASGQTVEAANFNDPKQTVISGTAVAVDLACTLMKARGAKRALHLAVSAPFHSSLMRPAAETLRAALAETPFQRPTVDVVNNIDAAVQTSPEAIREALYRQAYGPVRWVQVVQALRARGISCVIECGPGKVLSGLVKRVEPELAVASLFEPTGLLEAQRLVQ